MGNNPTIKDAIKEAFMEWEREHAYPPEIHFKRSHLPPSGWEYVGPDDVLQISIYTTASTTGLTLALRQLTSDGREHYMLESLDGVQTSTLTTKRFKLAEGWLIGACVSNLGGGLADQVCWISMALQRGVVDSTAPHTMLQQGYVSNLISVSWPPTYSRGPAPTIVQPGMVLIASQTLAAPAASVVFSTIPQTYTHLLLTIDGATTDAALFGQLGIQFNGDTGANYDYESFSVTGSASGANPQFAQTKLSSVILSGLTATANTSGSGVVWMMNYKNSAFFKNSRTNYDRFETLGTTTTYGTGQISGLWRNTAAITSITLFDQSGGNLGTGSSFTLYGIL